MIGALYRLPPELRKKMRLHLTILEEPVLRKELGAEAYQLDTVKDTLVFHGWLDTATLADLYRRMDFILICRERNKVTLSNFPSKLPELMGFGAVPVCSDVGDYAQLYLEDGMKCRVIQGSGSGQVRLRPWPRPSRCPPDKLFGMKKNTLRVVEARLGYRNWARKIEQFLLE